MTRYVFIGAGAIGSGLGGCLARAGSEAVLVARPAHVEAVRADGLRLRTPDFDERVSLAAVTGPDELRLRTDDVLVLTTKTHQATAALAEWADAEVYARGSSGSDSTTWTGGDEGGHGDAEPVGRAWQLLPVLTALNGVSSEQLALRYFDRVFAVCVWMPAVFLEPGEVIVRATPRRGIFHVGAVHTATGDDESAADQAVLAELQRDWRAADCEVILTDQVMAWKYRKLISNMGNAIQALVGENGDPARVREAIDAEARAVLDGAGIDYIDDETEEAARQDSFRVAPVAGEPEQLGGSSWQSLARGSGTIETDYLNGEIARIARRHGLAAPANAGLSSLARIAAATGQRPGSVSADDLARRLGLDDPERHDPERHDPERHDPASER